MKSKPSKALRSTFMAFFRHSLSLFLLFFLRLLSLLCPGDRLPLAAPCAVVMLREGARGGQPRLEARPSPRFSRGRPPQARTAWLMSRLRPAAASSRAAESTLMPSSAPPPGTSATRAGRARAAPQPQAREQQSPPAAEVQPTDYLKSALY